jgi:phosphatidate cytidylyltransferase
MKTRVITGAVIAAVLIPLFIIGGLPLNLLLLVLTLGASYELFNMYNQEKKLPRYLLFLTVLIAGGMYYAVQSYFEQNLSLEWAFLWFMLLIILNSVILVFEELYTAENFAQMFVSVMYPAVGFASIFALRYIDVYVLGFLFMITIMTDIFAYAVGVPFGKHKLAVKISPKKSWEGTIGGTVIATILTIVYVYLVQLEYIGAIELNIFVMIILILFISIVGQIGDLIASKLKRHYGIKDFSNLFPGHGGVMDRFDSALFAAMVLIVISKVVELL